MTVGDANRNISETAANYSPLSKYQLREHNFFPKYSHGLQLLTRTERSG